MYRIASPAPASALVPSLTALAALTALVAAPAPAASQNVGYAIEPGATYVSWDDDLALDDGWIWGGAFTFELGPRIRLSPYFLKGTDLEGDPSALDTPFDAPVESFDTRFVGTTLDVDLVPGPVSPFLRIGGGIVRIDPDGREALERISLQYGGGVRFGVGRAGVRLFAQGSSYRLSPERLYALGDPSNEEGDRANLLAGARVSIPLSDLPDDPGVGLQGASVPMGIFAGELDFSSESGLGNQRIAGVRAGIGFNPLVSLQGFFWRGVNDDVDALQDVRGYGAEGRFDLGSGTGLSPFLLAGGARIDYDQDSDDPAFADREDQTALILGGGVALRLTDRLDLEIAARDYLLDTTGDLEDASDPGELENNWLFSAGLTAHIGGSTTGARARDADRERERLRAEVERLESRLAELRTDTAAAAAGPDRMGRTEAAADTGAAAAETTRMRTPDGRVITLPVLDEGAIYIRFGPEGADTRGAGAGTLLPRTDLRTLIREEMGSASGDSIGGADLAELERRILDRLERRGLVADTAAPEPRGGASPEVLERLDAIEAELMRRLDEIEAERDVPARPVRTPVDVEVDAPRGETAWDRAGRFDTRRMLPFAALGFTDTDEQGVLGVRFDFGPLSDGSRLNFIPSAAFGFGTGESVLTVMGNVQFPFATFGARRVEPYLLGGVGFHSPTFLGLSTGIGAEFDLRSGGRGDPLRSYVELQGINLFDETRLHFGLSLSR